MINATVSALIIYPIKGCRGQSLQRAELTAMGLAGDREFAVLMGGQWANQKTLPGLRSLAAIWRGDNKLHLSYPHCDDFVLTDNKVAEAPSIEIYSKPVAVEDMGADVASWLSAALGAPLQLVRMEKSVDWFFPLSEFTEINGQPQNKFVDAAPVLITSEQSLADLNARLGQAVPMDRFRPNIVLAGLDSYLEDELPNFVFPASRLRRLAVCERCTVTTIDQQSGATSKEPLLTLSRYRRRQSGYAGGIMFGVYALPVAAGSLGLGDKLGDGLGG
ncbi:MAG: hypothetical protein ACI9WS_001412 [Paraglaciecola psychrophila]|jgi:uncharacterized protein YcbX